MNSSGSSFLLNLLGIDINKEIEKIMGKNYVNKLYEYVNMDDSNQLINPKVKIISIGSTCYPDYTIEYESKSGTIEIIKSSDTGNDGELSEFDEIMPVIKYGYDYEK